MTEQVDLMVSPIPAGTHLKAKITILQGNYDGPKEYLHHIAKVGKTGSVYVNLMLKPLDCEYTDEALFFMIGLHSARDPSPNSKFVEIGKESVIQILNSAYGLRKDDMSETALAQRTLDKWLDLDGLEVGLVVKDKEPWKGRVAPEVHYFLNASDDRWHALFPPKKVEAVAPPAAIPFSPEPIGHLNPVAPPAVKNPAFEDFDEDIPF